MSGPPSDSPAEEPAADDPRALETPAPQALAAEPELAHDLTGLDVARKVAGSINGRFSGRRGRRNKKDSQQRPGSPQRSGPSPDGRDPQMVGAGLERLFEERGWRMRVNLQTLLARWPSIVGETNAQHSRPDGFDDGVLSVRTDATVWASSLRSIAPQVVAKLNADLGAGSLTRIVVRGPDAPSWKHGRLSVPGRGPRDTYG